MNTEGLTIRRVPMTREQVLVMCEAQERAERMANMVAQAVIECDPELKMPVCVDLKGRQ